jgi:hypothetical protein
MLTGPVDSPLPARRSCSKKGTMAAGFSMGIPAVRSIITETSSEASALAAALTTGALGIVRLTVFFFFFFAAGGLAAVLDWERR